ncbi:MAG TPA: amidase domain-containing protein [Thermoleophilia bacterium]|nr:amidase domain-containing protein [Thermoleophilia bacterium]
MPSRPLSARRLLAGLILGAAVLLLGAPAAPVASAAAPAAAADPAAAARGYLEARATAVTAADPARILGAWVAPGSPLARRQVLLARGAARRHLGLGRLVDAVRCDVELRSVVVGPDGTTARVRAHTIVTTTWHGAGGVTETEASGLDHSLTLRRDAAGWHVVADRCVDTLAPALLEAAGAGLAQVDAEATALERAAAGRRPATPGDAGSALVSSDVATLLPALRAIYPEVIYYDRAAAVTYADRYALSYNSTYIRFSADCCNYASQCAKAGKMPEIFVDPQWWYDKNGTSSPSDDRWSASWPSCSRQITAWAGRRIGWVTSVSLITRGDFIYYDWTGNGSWDHVAVCVGTNSLGQKIVDAHTTDHYHVYWKLGTASTKYKFARVYTKW